MPLIVEDGSGRTDSESYISVADAETRLASLGNTTFAALATDALKEQALRRATNFMEGQFRSRWKGTRLKRDQALSWPRYGAMVDGWDIDSTVIPEEVSNACADLALKASTEDLAPDLERAIIREKIGPIETEWAPHSSQAKSYRAINAMLAPFLKGSSAMATLVRA